MAIIVVLAAVAIPTFGKQLETSRETADMETLRAAYTEALSFATLDASDGALDDKNGKTDLSVTGISPSSGAYTVTLGTLPTKMAFKQSKEGWQYVNKDFFGQTAPEVTHATTSVVFTFSITDGDITLSSVTAGSSSSTTPSTPDTTEPEPEPAGD